jgi:hypothetical protein
VSKKHLTQIWQWVSIPCLLFLLTTAISMQGGSESLGRYFGEIGKAVGSHKTAIGYFGAIIGGGLLLLSSLVFLLHARRHGLQWQARILVVWLEGLDTQKWEAKVFQVGALVIFIALPVAGIVKCMIEAEAGDICEYSTTNFYKGEETTLLWPPVAKKGEQMRLRRAGAGDAPCNEGVEIFPRTFTPLAFYGLPVAAMVTAALALGVVFFRANPPPTLEI